MCNSFNQEVFLFNESLGYKFVFSNDRKVLMKIRIYFQLKDILLKQHENISENNSESKLEAINYIMQIN